MAYEITSSSIHKLEHEITEIRIRSLKHIEGRILRALQQNENIIFNGISLVKQLIRWFGRQPLCEESTVLNLIITIFRSSHFHEICNFFGTERLEKEMNKIHEIVQSSAPNKNLVITIKEIIDNYEPIIEIDQNEMIEISSVASSNSTIDMCSLSEVINDEYSQDYEKPWSIVSIRDYNSMKSLNESLSPERHGDEIKHAFAFLKTAINDYPAEYFLQPPYIFKGLIKLFTSNKTNSSTIIFEKISYLTKSLTGRVKSKKLSATYCFNYSENSLFNSKTQITIGKYCLEVFKICIEHLKNFNDTINPEEIHSLFNLLFDVINLMNTDSSTCIPIKAILTDISIMVKYHRLSLQNEEKPNQLHRLQYILLIFIIVKLVDHHQPTEIVNCNESISCCTYNPSLYSDERQKKVSMNRDDIWIMELEIALLDFPLSQYYEELFESIKNIIKLNNHDKFLSLQDLLNCDDKFLPAIKILRQPETYSNEEFIMLGFQAMDTLSIHKSLDFVKNVIEMISKNSPLYDGNVKLKSISENILLRLFAHENYKIKRIAYKQSSNSVKSFFATLMNGENTISRMHNNQLKKANIFGIPFTMEIICEIICFGYKNEDLTVNDLSEVMLSLLIKSRPILDEENWSNILEILNPNFPLLQCLCIQSTDLGKLIFNLFDPENNISIYDLIQGNIRFLFSSDSSIRTDALARLLYILSRDQNIFIPNVLEISDTLPNDICVVTIPRDPEKILSGGGIYDSNTTHSLLQILKSDDIEPSIRKTTLMQLNVICQDPDLNELVTNENGWYFAIKALENSLKKEQCMDYPDTAIPAIGIISKILLCNPEFRRDLSNEGNFYILLIRALLLFHHDIVLQQDCSLALFLLLFSNYIIGSGKNISVPKLFENIKLPLKCQYHWITSPNMKHTKLEKMFLELSEEANELKQNTNSQRNLINCNSSDSEMMTNRNYMKKSKSELIIKENCYNGLQFIRIKFASLWFNGLDSLICKSMNSKFSDLKTIIDYSLIPYSDIEENNDGTINIIDSCYQFNSHLKLNKKDLRAIKYTSQIENYKSFLRKITNSTDHNHFVDNISSLQILLRLTPSNKDYSGEILVKMFKKYIISVPTNEIELKLFEYSLNLFKSFIRLRNEYIYNWIVEQLETDKHCVFLSLFKNYQLSINVYENLSDFFKELIKMAIEQCNKLTSNETNIDNGDNTDKTNCFFELFTNLFEYLLPIMEESFHKRSLDVVRCLANLLECLTESNFVEVEGDLMQNVTKKLFYFIITLKSFSQAGSNLNKNCLLIICNLMEFVDEFVLDENHIKFLSGLCNHPDYEIRALSWCILSKVAKNLNGAQSIVKGLSYLPGGFHACCLSTLLDSTEVSLVRATAGGLFSNLLTHTVNNDSENGLHMSVVPLCIEQEPTTLNNGVNLIKLIFNKHRFYVEIFESLDQFYIFETAEKLLNKNITTCEIVKAYCSILINFIDLDLSLVEELAKESFLKKMFNLIRIVPSFISKGSLKMTSEICNLMIRFLKCEDKFIQKSFGHDQGFIIVLTHFLNLNYYEYLDKTVIINILNILKIFAQDSNTYKLICEIFSGSNTCGLIELLIYGITCNENSDFQNCCFKFMISMLIKSEEETLNFITLPAIFDQTKFNNRNFKKLSNRKSTFNEFSVSNNDNRKSRKRSRKCCELIDFISLNENESAEIIYGSEIIIIKLFNLFEAASFTISKTKSNIIFKKSLICETIAITLKTSLRARLVAEEKNFFSTILLKLSELFESMSMSCTDFIRKYGDAKKDPIIQDLMILYGIIMNWFSVTSLTNEKQILEFSKICLFTWPWMSHSESFREIFIKVLVFLTEDSIQVCKQFSLSITSYSNSIIQLVGKLALDETKKVKHPNIDYTTLDLVMKILANCCSCIEGRMQILKLHLLEVFNLFHPAITKSQKSFNKLIISWLEFWEIFTRYPEGATVQHLILLCVMVEKTNHQSIRLLCLSVLRNMSFLEINRSALLSSQDFMYLIKSVLTEGNEDEKLIVCTIIWKLIADNYKAKHIIKSTSIPNKLKIIIENNTKSNDLVVIAELIMKILNTN